MLRPWLIDHSFVSVRTIATTCMAETVHNVAERGDECRTHMCVEH